MNVLKGFRNPFVLGITNIMRRDKKGTTTSIWVRDDGKNCLVQFETLVGSVSMKLRNNIKFIHCVVSGEEYPCCAADVEKVNQFSRDAEDCGMPQVIRLNDKIVAITDAVTASLIEDTTNLRLEIL